MNNQPIPPSNLELFSKSPIFQGLTKEEIETLFQSATPLTIEKGNYLIREGDLSNEIFIVLAGSLEVTKYDTASKRSHVIDILGPGDTVGEIAFLDHGPRTASVQGLETTRLFSISVDEIQKIVEKDRNLQRIYSHLCETISRRLRHTNDLAIKALRSQMEEAELRARMGTFLVGIITALSIFTYILSGLQYLLTVVSNSTVITLPLTLGAGVFIFLMIHYFDMPLSEFGVTKTNWKQSFCEGFFITLPFSLLFGIIVKWLLIQYVPEFYTRSLFDPFALIHHPQDKTWPYWIGLNSVYVFIIIPVQELLCRGGLQGLLEKFLTGKHRLFLSIIMSNLIFSSIHVYFSPYVAMAVFILGCYVGVLYARTHNLLGCWIAHSLVGLVTLSILGIVGAIFE